MNPFYTNTIDLIDGTKARASSVEANFSSVELGFDSFYASMIAALATKAVSTGQSWTGINDFSGGTLRAATPSGSSDVATKGYTDSLIALLPSGSLPSTTGNQYKVLGNDGAGNVSWGSTILALMERSSTVAASDINLTLGNYFFKTISGATTLTVSNVPANGTVAAFVLELTNGGSATVNFWTGVKWAGGVMPSLTAAGTDILSFYTRDGGVTWRGNMMSKDSK